MNHMYVCDVPGYYLRNVGSRKGTWVTQEWVCLHSATASLAYRVQFLVVGVVACRLLSKWNTRTQKPVVLVLGLVTDFFVLFNQGNSPKEGRKALISHRLAVVLLQKKKSGLLIQEDLPLPTKFQKDGEMSSPTIGCQVSHSQSGDWKAKAALWQWFCCQLSWQRVHGSAPAFCLASSTTL